MEEHTIWFSIKDVIRILESAPVRPDMVTKITVSQVMNRAPVAHLSVERALKFLIQKRGREFKVDHNLHTHFKALRHCDPDVAEYLDEAFHAATQFYGLNKNVAELKHLESLDAYLSMVGTSEAFQKMRYWELDLKPHKKPHQLIGQVWLPIHLEILHAMLEVYRSRKGRPRRTVEDRVEWAVRKALWPSAHLGYSPGSDREDMVIAYGKWIKSHASFRDALAEAIRSRFYIGNQLMNQVVAQGYESLRQSQDPAVLYLTTRLDVLPRQPRDVIPPVEWICAKTERSGTVSTPSGHYLGFIERGFDGLWHITPMSNGLGGAARAKTQTDARCYLAQLLTGTATLIIDGIQRTVRLIGEKYERIQSNYEREQPAQDADAQTSPWSHKLACWDRDNTIRVGQEIRVEVKYDDVGNEVDVLEGHVVEVNDHEIYVAGTALVDVVTAGD